MTFNLWTALVAGALLLTAISPLFGIIAVGVMVFCIAKPDTVKKLLDK